MEPAPVNTARNSSAALPIPSVVRTAKVTTVEAHAAEPVGQLDDALIAEIMATLIGVLSA